MVARSKSVSRGLLAVLFIAAGANHFWHSAIYVRITPPMFPHRLVLVWISGFFEILGGVGLLIPMLRRAAAAGLILLLMAVFPANIYMAMRPDRFADLHLPVWTLWARLPLQALLIAWVWSGVAGGPPALQGRVTLSAGVDCR